MNEELMRGQYLGSSSLSAYEREKYNIDKI